MRLFIFEFSIVFIGSAIVFLPNDTKVSGQCKYDGSNTTQEFKVSFFDDTWSFSALISQDEESILKSSGSLLRDLKAEPSYSWKRVELIYVVDESFPDAKDSDIGQRKNVTKDESEGAFKASGDGSYKCNTGETLELQEGISMDLGNFQYKAFGTDNSGNFTNNDVSECAADKGGDDDDDDDDDTVAIVLGSVFGGLAFILLIAFIGYCVKKRKQRDYEVM